MSDELLFGKKPRLNKNGHPYGCTCRPCLGARSRRKGMAAQRAVAKTLGVEARYRGELANEENWRHPWFRLETKSGAQVPKSFTNAYEQAEQAAAIGDSRATAVVYVPLQGPELIVMRLQDFKQFADQQGPSNTSRLKEALRSISKLADEAREGL